MCPLSRIAMRQLKDRLPNFKAPPDVCWKKARAALGV
jgi:hypothetical protein